MHWLSFADSVAEVFFFPSYHQGFMFAHEQPPAMQGLVFGLVHAFVTPQAYAVRAYVCIFIYVHHAFTRIRVYIHAPPCVCPSNGMRMLIHTSCAGQSLQQHAHAYMPQFNQASLFNVRLFISRITALIVCVLTSHKPTYLIYIYDHLNIRITTPIYVKDQGRFIAWFFR